MLWVVLVQIPLGTVVLEEVAFRGVLPALMGVVAGDPLAVGAGARRVGPVRPVAHPAVDRASTTPTRRWASALGHNVVLTTTLAVVSMTIAGIAMCALARVGKGIKTTMLLHWATNSLGFFAAWLLLH